MKPALHNVIPEYLKHATVNRQSDIWGTHCEPEQGAYVFVQAPSGSGKTTLINLLYGEPITYSGKALWGTDDISTFDAEGLARLRSQTVSIIFQDLRLFPELTTLENIEVKRTLTKHTSADTAKEYLARLGLADKLQARAATLSYGEQQRVAIVRALVQPFSWLLMDEPFSHLDAANRTNAAVLIQEVAGQQNAGFLLADLDDNDYFPYTQKLMM